MAINPATIYSNLLWSRRFSSFANFFRGWGWSQESKDERCLMVLEEMRERMFALQKSFYAVRGNEEEARRIQHNITALNAEYVPVLDSEKMKNVASRLTKAQFEKIIDDVGKIFQRFHSDQPNESE